MRLFHKGIVLRSAGDWVGEKKRGRIETERLIEKADPLLKAFGLGDREMKTYGTNIYMKWPGPVR